jgi:hypothetical protein
MLLNSTFAQSVKKFQKCSLASSHFVEELPTDFNNVIIISNVRIDGVDRPLRFILDSGTSYSMLSKDIADEIGFKPTNGVAVNDGNERESLKLGMLNVYLGNVSFHNVGFGIEASKTGPWCDIDGIIGYNVMRTCVWKLGIGQTIITDNKKSFRDISSYYQGKLTYGPLVVAGFENGYRATMFLDLGDDGTVEAATSRLKYIRQKKVVTGVGQPYLTMVGSGHGSKDAQSVTKLLEVPGFEFGGKTVKNVVVYTDDNPLFAVDAIGAGILNYYQMILDFPGKKIYSLNIADEYINKGFKTFGFKYEREGNELRIRFLWNNSSAQRAGLKLGDKIEAINNIAVKKLLQTDPCNVYEQFKDVTSIQLKVAGHNAPITLKKEPLFNNE